MLSRPATFALGVSSLLAALVGGCSCGNGGSGDSGFGGQGGGAGHGHGASSAHGGNGAGFVGSGASSGTGHQCKNLECQQVDCSGGGTTSISGTVYEPAGKTPLYNVVVYVPNAPLDAIPEGASCDKCSAALSGEPLVSTVTDTAGHFQLDDVPVGDDIPLVIQVGKWRRELTIPKVDKCVDNPQTDPQVTRLPKNQSEGHLPRIALSTGSADPLECFLHKIGLDIAEFTPESGTGRVNLFHGNGTASYDASVNGGAAFSDSQGVLWPNQAALMTYDIVLLACESSQRMSTKPAPSLQAMQDYANAGGRIFASHYHNGWLEHGPQPFPTVATIVDDPDPNSPITGTIDQSFPKGAALAQWLVNVGGSTTLGSIQINSPQNSIDGVNNPPAQQWITFNSTIQYFTFNTPIGVPDKEQCGRFVHSDVHVSSGDQVGSPFPTGCQTTDLSPQEKALLFMLFDLSACVQNDHDPTCPPGVQPCGTGQPACPAGQTCDASGCCKTIPH